MAESSADRTAAILIDAHPLARRLADTVPADAGPIIVVGDGRGRNSRALEQAGWRTVAIPDDRPYTQLGVPARSFAAGLSTHAYLHGNTAKIRLGIAELARVLRAGAPAYLTLGSIRDVRYGFGDPLDENTFAPGNGAEAGIPHAFFDRDGAIDVLRPLTLVSLEEVEVDDVVGKWAHLDEEPPGKVHWFVAARRP
ncbi:MAG: hypothetical protein JO101_07410 [Candidatus Eremiobacteraeota bacterium]|nr:hypothetical protein [Candidatus Eremiobacteraeota bacterium]MBV8355130.1 hypothetical protein [Candidatus Eremiobacteraeota bacterium]